jgi:hypothetical protein
MSKGAELRATYTLLKSRYVHVHVHGAPTVTRVQERLTSLFGRNLARFGLDEVCCIFADHNVAHVAGKIARDS